MGSKVRLARGCATVLVGVSMVVPLSGCMTVRGAESPGAASQPVRAAGDEEVQVPESGGLGKHYDGVSSMQDDLEAHGYDCGDSRSVPLVDVNPESSTCDDLAIAVYETSEGRAESLSTLMRSTSVVYGENWIVFTNPWNTERVQNAIGGVVY